MRGIAFALLGALGALALFKLRAAPDTGSRGFAASYLVIALCLALLYGVHYFDAKLYFAPPDHVHFVFIIISLLAPLAHMRPVALALYAASYGSLIAIFESLTGGIPFALAMMPLLLALGFEGERREYLTGCFCSGAASVSPLSPASCSRRSSRSLFSAIRSRSSSLLFYRMFGAPLPESGTTLTLGYLLSSYRRWSSLIGFGSPNLGTVLVLGSFAVLAVETWRTRSAPTTILLACWLGVAALLVWATAFLNHTAVHPYFMARLLGHSGNRRDDPCCHSLPE